jgi:hypothetical protein
MNALLMILVMMLFINLEFEIITYPHQKKYNTDEKMDGRVYTYTS